MAYLYLLKNESAHEEFNFSFYAKFPSINAVFMVIAVSRDTLNHDKLQV